MVSGSVLISYFYMFLSNFPSTEEFWRNTTGARPADRALNTGEHAVKTSLGIGRGLDMLIGHSVS